MTRAPINLPNAAWAVSRQMEHEPVADGGTRRSIGKLVDASLEALAGRELRHVCVPGCQLPHRRRLRPLLASRRDTEKLPNPTRRMSPPFFSSALNGPQKTASTAEDASAFEIPALSATASHELIFVHVSTPLCWFETTVFLRRGCESNATSCHSNCANPLECKGCSVLLQQKRPAERRSSLFFWPRAQAGHTCHPICTASVGNRSARFVLRINGRQGGRLACRVPFDGLRKPQQTRARSPSPIRENGDDFEAVLDVVRDVGEVLGVLLGISHLLDAAPELPATSPSNRRSAARVHVG